MMVVVQKKAMQRAPRWESTSFWTPKNITSDISMSSVQFSGVRRNAARLGVMSAFFPAISPAP